MSTRPEWIFQQDEKQRWRWTRIDRHKVQVASIATFARRIDCVMDAVRYAVRRHRVPAD